MSVRALKDIPQDLVEFNRERLCTEVAQAIGEMMHRKGVSRSKLAELLDQSKSRITHMLSGHPNFRLKTVADTFLVLGMAPHLALGTDLEEFRLATIEDNEQELKGGKEQTVGGAEYFSSSFDTKGGRGTDWSNDLTLTFSAITGEARPVKTVFGSFGEVCKYAEDSAAHFKPGTSHRGVRFGAGSRSRRYADGADIAIPTHSRQLRG